MIKRKKNPPVFPQSRRRTFPNLWPFILPFPSSFVALVSSYLLLLSSSRLDSQAHCLTSMINGWQTAAILSSVKCVLSRNDTVVSCHLLQTTRHSQWAATYRRNVFHPHLEATADSKVLEKRDETAHLSSPRPVHLVRGLAQNGVSTISNSICLCRMKKAVTLVIMFPLLIPELIQPERLPKKGSWVPSHPHLLPHIAAAFYSQKPYHPRVTGLGGGCSQEPSNRPKNDQSFLLCNASSCSPLQGDGVFPHKCRLLIHSIWGPTPVT